MNAHLRTMLNEHGDGDKWGLAISARFAMNDVLMDLGADKSPDYTPSFCGSDTSDPMYGELFFHHAAGCVTTDDIAHADRVLARYCALLKVFGVDY